MHPALPTLRFYLHVPLTPTPNPTPCHNLYYDWWLVSEILAYKFETSFLPYQRSFGSQTNIGPIVLFNSNSHGVGGGAKLCYALMVMAMSKWILLRLLNKTVTCRCAPSLLPLIQIVAKCFRNFVKALALQEYKYTANKQGCTVPLSVQHSWTRAARDALALMICTLLFQPLDSTNMYPVVGKLLLKSSWVTLLQLLVKVTRYF